MLFLLLLAIVSVVQATAVPAPATDKLPAGVSDLLAATPTMLSSVSTPLRDTNADLDVRTKDNTLTITGSKILFATTNKPQLVRMIQDLIANSEPNRAGDLIVTRAIMALLSIDRTDTAAAKQIESVLGCREHQEMMRKCIEALVDMAAEDKEKRIDN